MALSSSWFQNWGPPQNFGFPDDIPKFTPKKTSAKYTPNFLPFLMSLGALANAADPSERAKNRKYERTGPFRTVYEWKQLDFDFPSESDRISAITNEYFVPENNLPLGIEVYKDRLFISMPKWKGGVPATLAVLPKNPKEVSPKLKPYPSWDWHTSETCEGLTSVFRMQADSCGRLWVLDSGQIDVTIKAKQICPPAIFLFDLKTDHLIFRYEFPEEFILQNSLFSNIVVDIRNEDCEDTHAYVTDVWRYGLMVFSMRKMKSWRISDHLFYPDPLAAAYKVHGLDFEWTDGVFGIALSPMNEKTQDRTLYYHPMSSFREFYARASVVRNETGWDKVKDAFRILGQSRGKSGQASASAMDRSGILFFNLVTRDSVGCWDSRKPYKRGNLGVVAHSERNLVFPNDLKVDQEKRQSVWVISNRLPIYLYKGLDWGETNFRVLRAYADDAVRGSICDPNYSGVDTFDFFEGDEDCF